MDPRDDDIEFDFFDDEPATGETQPRELGWLRAPRRRPRGPVGPPRGALPLLRLLALVIFVIVLVVVFALLVQSCASTSKHAAYASYMSKVGQDRHAVDERREAGGDDARNAGLKVADIVTKLHGIAD